MTTAEQANKELAKQQTLALYHQQSVKELFDEYADTFDEHLVEGLRYDVPNLLLSALLSAVAITATTPPPPTTATTHTTLLVEVNLPSQDNSNDEFLPSVTWKKCLDLGCGTGLAGVCFRPYCQYLQGVDISSRMIAKARQRKGIYHRLDHNTLLAHMKQINDATFDLVISADVFMYVLDLQLVFVQVKRILQPGGYFVFSTESFDETAENTADCENTAAAAAADANAVTPKTISTIDFVRQSSERFAHSRHFVWRLANDGFTVTSTDSVVLRMDEGKEVKGDIFVLQRT